MANMKHKSIDARRTRRNRYVSAIKPIKEMFHCTAAEAAGHVRNELTANNKLRDEITGLKLELVHTNEELAKTKEELIKSKEDLQKNVAELVKTKKELEGVDTELVKAVQENEELKKENDDLHNTR